MTRVLTVLALVSALGACSAFSPDRVEIQSDDATGSDKMRISPCACEPLDYQHPSFKWVG